MKYKIGILGLAIFAGSSASQASLVESIKDCIQAVSGIRYLHNGNLEYNCSQSGGYETTESDQNRRRISYQLARDIDNAINPNHPAIVNFRSSYDLTYSREDLGLTVRCEADNRGMGDIYPPVHFCYVEIEARKAVIAMIDERF